MSNETTVQAARAGGLAAWGRFAARHPRSVIGTWIVLLLVVGLVAVRAGGEFVDQFELPGTESQAAVDLLRERFPQQAGEDATVVFRAPDGVTAPGTQAQLEAALAQLARLPDVVAVSSPFESQGQAISRDGTIAFATVQYSGRAVEVPPESVKALLDTVDALGEAGLEAEVGGPVVQNSEQEPPGKAELIGFAAAAVVLFLAFGSLTAMAIPLATALLSLGAGIMVITILARWLPMGTFTAPFAAMIGIGVGIDYSLFVVTRFREELGRGRGVEDAVGVAIDTAGRAVIFAGFAVGIALLGLTMMGIPFVGALGVAAAVVVAMSVLVATIVLPALLGWIGRGVDRWRLGRALPAADDGQGTWYRFAIAVQRRPALFAVLAAGVLLLLASPALDVRLGSTDAGNNPTTFHSRRAYDLLSEGFGPGFNGPLLIAVELPPDADPATLVALREQVAGTAGVAAVSPVQPGPDGDAAVLMAFPVGSPQDQSTEALIVTLREEVIPAALQGSGTRAFIGGQTAAFVDIGSTITTRLPVFFALVIGLSFVLLMVVFRSVAIPLKAAAMNLLAIGAAYGVLVAVFQWGWLGGLLNIGREGPIESFLPMMLFAILFGLSMDYEVFLLSRVRENYLHGRDNGEAVAAGVGQTARVITAAAAIMIAVFLSFALSEGRVIKEFGLGLAVAVFVDATIVRLVLVPATMGLLGRANWWLPAFLERVLPRISIEGPEDGGAGFAPQPVAAPPPSARPPEDTSR